MTQSRLCHKFHRLFRRARRGLSQEQAPGDPEPVEQLGDSLTHQGKDNEVGIQLPGGNVSNAAAISLPHSGKENRAEAGGGPECASLMALEPSTRPPLPETNSTIDEFLPVEIMYHFMSYLRPEARAALALTSKLWRARCGGPMCFQLSKTARRRLLPVLERDLPFHSYCGGCSKLHTLSNMTQRHPTIQTVRCWRRGWEAPQTMPPLLTHKLFRLTMQWYRERRDYPRLIGKIEKQMDSMYWRTKYDGKAIVSGRVVGGDLMFRISDIILPPQSTWKSFDSIRHLRKILQRSGGYALCPHQVWAHQYPFLRAANIWFEPNVDGVLPVAPTQLDWFTSPELHCMLDHDQPCELSCTTSLAGCRTGLVKSCHLCYTDFTVNAIDIDYVGRALVLTSWANVGSGLTVDDHKWTCHFRDTGRKKVAFKRADVPHVYMAFEAIHNDQPGDEHTFRPQVTRQELGYWVSRRI